jgi:RimJ/RimL family protein N-acetyltransferase
MYFDNVASVKAYLRADWIIEGVLKDHYLYEGKPQDRILVACFNPSIFSDEYHKKGLYSFDDIYG